MVRHFIATAALAIVSLVSPVYSQCGSGSPHATVTGSSGSYQATRGGSSVYSGGDYRAAVQAALDSISSGQRVAVIASGSIGANSITVGSGKIFEGCGTINVASRSGRGAIESTGTTNAEIRYLTMTGNPYFGLLFYGTRGLKLGQIVMNLSGGMGIRFHRDEPMNYDVTMGSIRVTGASSHAVETWNIDGLNIGEVIARNVGECGLLLQNTRNAKVDLVDGDNVAAGTGYATLRFANQNGRLSSGSYTSNVFINRVKSRGGGRGFFCVSESGGAVIENLDLAANGNNAVLIENCYGVTIRNGLVQGGGEVRLSARTEFANSRDISINLEVNNNSVRESPCGVNVRWSLRGNHSRNICTAVVPPPSGSPPPPTSPPPSNPPPSTPPPSTPPPSTPPPSGCSPLYGQCGGSNWSGPKCCSAGTCRLSNEWYSQCLA